jgi:hypothetical protein
LAISGWLFPQGPDTVRRRQAERLAELRDGAMPEVLKAQQYFIRCFANLADSLQARGSQTGLNACRKLNAFDRRIVRQFWSGKIVALISLSDLTCASKIRPQEAHRRRDIGRRAEVRRRSVYSFWTNSEDTAYRIKVANVEPRFDSDHPQKFLISETQ